MAGREGGREGGREVGRDCIIQTKMTLICKLWKAPGT